MHTLLFRYEKYIQLLLFAYPALILAHLAHLSKQVLMSGYGLARNSSKVMAPPGGHCSDIFGTAAPYVEPPSAAQRTRNESTVFRSPARIPTADHTVQAAARRGQSQVFSNAAASPVRTGRVMTAASQNQSSVFASEPEMKAASPARRVRPESMAYDIIEANVRADVKTSTRVVQPPGGRCSNIFG